MGGEILGNIEEFGQGREAIGLRKALFSLTDQVFVDVYVVVLFTT